MRDKLGGRGDTRISWNVCIFPVRVQTLDCENVSNSIKKSHPIRGCWTQNAMVTIQHMCGVPDGGFLLISL